MPASTACPYSSVPYAVYCRLYCLTTGGDVPRVNILKQIKVDERWKLVSVPRTKKGGYDWNALPDGRYFVEWWVSGRRKREAGGGTAAEALETAWLRKHSLEGKALGLMNPDEEETKRTAVHVAVRHYLESVEALKKP